MGADFKKRQQLLDILDKKTLICDGAMGTSLQALGFKEPSNIFMLKNDAIDIVSDIHLQYLKAGSDIIQTNTFGSNILKLDQSGLSSEIENINIRAIEAARKAVSLFSSDYDSTKKIYIAGNIGPSGELLQPYGDTEYSAMVDSFSKQAEILLENDVDLILIETIMDLKEAMAAVEAIRDKDADIIIACSLTFMESGVTVMGNKAEEFGKIIIGAGCDIIGANCSVGSDSMVAITEKIRSANPDAKLIIQPNAGLPKMLEGKTVFTETPELMADNFKKILEFKPAIAGACCGSTPAHISKISELVHGKQYS